jgi:UDP-N-acetylmuramoyl-L-alanyl-D-glutamate--2,6-diaminopimelate ligase
LKLTDLLRAAGLTGPTLPDCEVKAISADSRQISPGALFAALPGAKADGTAYIASALAAGAVAVLAPAQAQVPAPAVHIKSDNPQLDLAKLAAAFYAPFPATFTAVTGTNGKTSTVNFTAQLWQAMGHKAASMGTLGIVGPGVTREGALTTSDQVTLSRDLRELYHEHITHVALEASSHGLHQYRLDGLNLKAAGFTYLGRDHLDYHGTLDEYFAAKALLFSRLLPATGTAVLNADIPEFNKLKALCRGKVMSYGHAPCDLQLLALQPEPDGLAVSLNICGQQVHTKLGVTGGFQAHNALCALGLILGSGTEVAKAVAALSQLRSVRGRLELVAQPAGAGVYVDYAHTPDALETVLLALRPHTHGKLRVVFGCGGNRDKGKRPVMGAIAAKLADDVIVTDDNPRLEQPSAIRAEILNGCRGALEVDDRAKAIQIALERLQPGDTLLIAGKGHEQGQIVGTEVRPFDDADVVRRALS